MLPVLRTILRPPEPLQAASVREWFAAHRQRTSGLAPCDRAIVGGYQADRVGFAFAAGYRAALAALDPALPDDVLPALCATEAGGVHPRAMATTLLPDGPGRFRISGEKRFATFAHDAQRLLVVASTGVDASGRNRLRVARVDPTAPGVTVTRLPETPFAPEIEHARVEFSGVSVTEADLLEGDGYDRYLKPFRTVEDIHVHAALMSYVLSVASRSEWPQALRERMVALVVALRALASLDPGAAETHLALAGALTTGKQILADGEGHWASVPSAERDRWLRDRALLSVAEKARTSRREAAWTLLSRRD